MITNIRQHLVDRRINVELHRPILDESLQIATFLLYNLSGQIVGYQQYNPNGNKNIFNNKLEGRYYTYRDKNNSTVAVWGIESLDFSNNSIFLTEGVFDACRLTYVGCSAIATLCNSPPKDYGNWLQLLNRPIIAICDNDSAGLKLASFADYYEIVPTKDLGDSTDDYVHFLTTKYS
jgi:hypothetical protein